VPIFLTAIDYGDTPTEDTAYRLAPGWELKGSFTMWDVGEFIQTEAKNYPDQCLFAILECFGQAGYTSDHAVLKNELYYFDIEEAEAAKEDPYLLWQFPKCHEKFMEFVAEASPLNWHDKMRWDDGSTDSPSILKGSESRSNFELTRWLQDQTTYVMRVPVEAACEALAVFPNGYFTDDLQPDENYMLAKALEENFKFRLIGIGATYLGFMRDTPVSAEEAAAVGQCLSPLYAYDPRADVSNQIAKIVEGETLIFIAYGNR